MKVDETNMSLELHCLFVSYLRGVVFFCLDTVHPLPAFLRWTGCHHYQLCPLSLNFSRENVVCIGARADKVSALDQANETADSLAVHPASGHTCSSMQTGTFIIGYETM